MNTNTKDLKDTVHLVLYQFTLYAMDQYKMSFKKKIAKKKKINK